MDKIFNTVRGFSMSRVLFIFTKMGIVDIIADAGSPLTAEEIAPRVAPDQQAEPLFRLLRCVAGLEFLDMHEGPVDNVNYHQTYRFSLNETSHLLRQGAPWRHLVLHLGNDAVYRVWGGLETAVKTGQSSVPATLGKPTFWDYLLEHDDINQYFNQAMSANTTQQTDQILGSYDFSQVSSVVDVGGGLGNLLFGILNKYPDISKGHLFEIQSVIDKVVVPDGLHERVELHAGSFLDENTGIPVGLDLYIVKAIIHDWADPEARQILTALRKAMRPHSKLLVMEHIVPRGGSTFASSIDLHMMVMLGAKERTEEEYKLLLASAGLVLTEVHSRQQRLNLIEARLAGPEEDNK